jgi:hypothetical protein
MKILLLIITIFLISTLLYFAFDVGKWFYHNILGWHKPTKEISFDGCSKCSTCKICSKEILQDSQGNWF